MFIFQKELIARMKKTLEGGIDVLHSDDVAFFKVLIPGWEHGSCVGWEMYSRNERLHLNAAFFCLHFQQNQDDTAGHVQSEIKIGANK